MKNTIKTIKKNLIVVTLFAATLGNANEITSIYKEVIKETALTLKNVKSGDLLSIKDYNGITLYKELIKSNGIYKKGFDLTALPNGDYYFEVDKDLEIKMIPFTVKANSVEFNKEAEVITYKPYVRKNNDLVLVSKLAPNLESLEIDIYFEANGTFELAYSEKIEDTQTIERAYKLGQGNYKIVFNTNNKEFTKFINN